MSDDVHGERGRPGVSRSLLLLALAALAVSCSSTTPDMDAADRTTSASRSVPDNEHSEPTGKRTGPVVDGVASSCVEAYTPQAVATRTFAFDGTVTGLGAGTTDRPQGGQLGYVAVTFEVEEWFLGGASREVTVDMSPPTAGSYETSVAGGAYSVGSRLLVSGEPRWGGESSLRDAVAWGCGFTRYHDLATADSWREAATSGIHLRGPSTDDVTPAK